MPETTHPHVVRQVSIPLRFDGTHVIAAGIKLPETDLPLLFQYDRKNTCGRAFNFSAAEDALAFDVEVYGPPALVADSVDYGYDLEPIVDQRTAGRRIVKVSRLVAVSII